MLMSAASISNILGFDFSVFELDVSATGDILVDEPTVLSERLVAVFSNMARLQTFRLMNSAECGPWPALLKAIFTTPTLTTCEILDSPWRRPEEKFSRLMLDLPRESSRLQKFVYRVPFTDCFPRESESYGRRDKVQGLVELSNLSVLVSLVCDSVEALEIPAELALHLADLPYPKLSELTFRGHEPLHTTDWSMMFHRAPRLRDVHIQTPAYFNDRLISPIISTCSIPHDDPVMRGMSNLQSLTISNPFGKNLFFQVLTYANLRTLSLKAFPLPDIVGARWSNVHSRVLAGSEVLYILNALQIVSLSTFELSYWVDASDVSLLSRIHISFPKLSTLEIHRFRPLAKENSENDPLSSMPNTLAKAVNLEHLMMNLDFPERPRHIDWRHDDSERSRTFYSFLEKEIVSTFAHAVPSLKTLGILSHHSFSSCWDIWEVTQTRGLIPQLQTPIYSPC
ncbi:hypothetical protein F5876DRAFT_78281 [Lentinula aff. lateritia]|uniref:Uncharacterized protein n=1 Tax=Lentinula aff. lateritia TaxID=2804960 RepID=A0ACC1TVW8_9AGAR|nr:hypothetical protein F5876DRAFT_78281 [Lentinula aff. lateritia]